MTLKAVPLDVRLAIADLLGDYAAYLDDNRLEEWLEFFTEDCAYRVISQENEAQGLPICLILCTNRNMLRDRIASLRKANKYNPHTDRHIVSAPRFLSGEGGIFAVETSYAVYQTDQEGESRLFSVGCYRDLIVLQNGTPKFKDKTVITNTAAIPTMLATPL